VFPGFHQFAGKAARPVQAFTFSLSVPTEPSLKEREEAVENQEGDGDAEEVEKDVAGGTVPGGDESLVKFIQDGDGAREKAASEQLFRSIGRFPGAERQKDQKGQNPEKGDVEEAVGVEPADLGDRSRIGQEKNGKNIGPGEEGKKRVHLRKNLAAAAAEWVLP
jgi:hypothetical protein